MIILRFGTSYDKTTNGIDFDVQVKYVIIFNHTFVTSVKYRPSKKIKN